MWFMGCVLCDVCCLECLVCGLYCVMWVCVVWRLMWDNYLFVLCVVCVVCDLLCVVCSVCVMCHFLLYVYVCMVLY